MIALNFRLPFWPSLLLILTLILSACAPAVEVDDFGVLPSATPTPGVTSTPLSPELPIALQPTQPAAEQFPLPARLAVLTSRARLLRGGNALEVRQAQSADIQIHDRIEIVGLDEQGQQSHSILQVPDSLNVELFHTTKVVLAEATQGAEGSSDVTLELDEGHLFAHLNEKKDIRVTVRTPHAIITSLTSGAEFDVCRTEELTCVVVKRGVIEIDAGGNREIIREGSAGVLRNDQAEPAVICAPVPKLIAWEERYRLSADAPALHEEIAALPQEPCLVGASGFPWDARILYRDEFSSTSTGWDRGQSEHFTAGYVRGDGGRRYYQVQAQGPADRYFAFVPNGAVYQDVNIDIQTRAELENGGDFLYGIVFRRSGDQYYAVGVSPVTRAWYFLKSSSDGLELRKQGIAKRLRGLEGQDTLRVEMYGSTFLVFINGRFIDWVSDADYTRGEAGLFVQTVGNPEARINFNSITIWDLPAPALNPAQGENCFNARDDDADGWIDQADPNCQAEEHIVSSLSTPSPTPPLPTRTPGPTRTPRVVSTPTAPPATDPPAPTATNQPTATQPPLPTLPPIIPTLPPLPTLPPILPTLPPILPTLPLPVGPAIETPMPG